MPITVPPLDFEEQASQEIESVLVHQDTEQNTQQGNASVIEAEQPLELEASVLAELFNRTPLNRIQSHPLVNSISE